MSKPRPTAPTPPSTQARRIIKSVGALVEREAATPEQYIQKIADLLHIEDAVRAQLGGTVIAEAADAEGVSQRDIVQRTGLAKSLVQKRVTAGRAALAAGRRELTA